MPIKSQVRASSQFVNVKNLAKVITEVLDDVINRLKTAGFVRLNHVVDHQAVRRQLLEHTVNFTDCRADPLDELCFRNRIARRKFFRTIPLELYSADRCGNPLADIPAKM